MPDDIDSKLVDKRVVHRYLKKGRLDEKEYEKHLKGLPDLAGQAVPVESNLDEDVEDEPDDVPAAGAAGSPKEP
jgi:hypothetical protein